MAELNANSSATTDLSGTVKDFSVNAQQPDQPTQQQKETYYDYPNSNEYLGYYKTIPELKKAIDSLATWTTGKGWTASQPITLVLGSFIGWGEDSSQSIFWNLQVQKKVFGDAYAEIIRDENDNLINIKPLYTGDMRVVVNGQGMIIRYEQRNNVKNGVNKVFRPHQILHLVNDRIANEIHGTSVIESCKWVIDARNEALKDERLIKHRELALGILYIDSDNVTKRNKIMTQYQDAVKNGEVLVLPKDTAELKDSGVKPQDRIAWIQYLENFFYQAVGVPRVIATSENFTEAASKVGYLTFEPIYTREQTDLETDLLNQTALKIKFNRPPSLMDNVQTDEKKNTGQIGFQENEVQASLTENE